jgi:uncharacterized protein YndB with AHSA1/START domain
MDACVVELETVVREVAIEASLENVWELLTDPDQAALWMGRQATFDLRPGGRYRVEVLPGRIASGEFIEVDPPHRLVHTWGWEAGNSSSVPPGSTTVEYELVPEGEGTRLKFTHKDLPNQEAADSHATGWDHYLERLAVASAGGDPGPDPWLTERME